MVKGFSGERSEILQVYFLDVSKDHDQVTPIIERGLAAIAKRGRVPWSTRGNGELEAPPAPRNLLEDLDEVLGDEPVPAAQVAPLLIALATEYSGLTGKQLCADLAAVGVKVPSSQNRYPVDPITIRKALAGQATADLDDES